MANAVVLDARQQRGAALAKEKGRHIRHVAGAKYLVPSATGTAGYVVDAEAGQCTCPDHEDRGVRCKHLWAVSYYRQEITLPDGSHVVTQAVRLTYAQNWPAYNRAQTEEKDRVQVLLRDLCSGVPQAEQKRGRPRLPLADVIYAATMKVYDCMSARRSMSDVRACEEKGLIEDAPSYNSMLRYAKDGSLAPVLSTLIEQSALPLRAVETQFAQDSTGFATATYVRWYDQKYGQKSRQRFVKLHAMVGTKTHIVTAAAPTEAVVGDSGELIPLLQRTAANGFDVQEVSADKAYLSHDNLAAIEAIGARPFIPFKSNSRAGGSPAWERLWHHFSANSVDFLAHYHRRSNVETAFSAMERKFGKSLMTRLPEAQFNEVLLKCLCHNLTCLVHAIHELNVAPKFWEVRP